MGWTALDAVVALSLIFHAVTVFVNGAFFLDLYAYAVDIL